MSYNILGINPGHNGSAALISDGELVYYVEEERLSRNKYDGNPFRAILDIVSRWHVDEIVIVGTTPELPILPWTGENPYSALVRKFYPEVKTVKLGNEHHYTHAACAFYNSGFEKAISIVIDGAGSYRQEYRAQELRAEGYEAESAWLCEYPSKISLIRKILGSNTGFKFDDGVIDSDSAVTITKAYEAVSEYLGFGFIEAGKTMGLAPYGKKDVNIPTLFNGTRGSKDIFIPHYPAGAFIDTVRNSYLIRKSGPTDWHNNEELVTDAQKNLAWAIQQESQKLVGDFIEKAIESSGVTNVCIAGGYGLNCVTNYYLVKRFPDVNFYFEPISHDGGTAIGGAQLAWYNRSQENADTTIRPQKTLYHGPEYTKEQLQSSLDKNSDKITTKKVTYKEIAQLIADRNIVALFQGRSEAGPRALGNRSILYDPRDPNGKDFVNVVKGREWFRPFAGSVLAEDGNEWFDLAGQGESPFMMMAVNVAADKLKLIPAICHVDDTCRVQTVTEEQNVHYYNLIKAFKELTEVPVLFNTSFNLAGDPLVETIDDAIDTLCRSKMKYLYLPELELLVTKNED